MKKKDCCIVKQLCVFACGICYLSCLLMLKAFDFDFVCMIYLIAKTNFKYQKRPFLYIFFPFNLHVFVNTPNLLANRGITFNNK